jgi:uncharacterized protein YbjQ (UPF0145 family)
MCFMSAGGRVCNCGLIKQNKVGTNIDGGVERCNACDLPIFLTVDAGAAQARGVLRDHVTTLQTLPGYRIVRVLGVVSELSATSGLTATVKGTNALDNSMAMLRRSAAELRANAIVGLTSSSFGAAGGITSVLGGDAVGVLLIGTAAVVEPIDDQDRPAIAD